MEQAAGLVLAILCRECYAQYSPHQLGGDLICKKDEKSATFPFSVVVARSRSQINYKCRLQLLKAGALASPHSSIELKPLVAATFLLQFYSQFCSSLPLKPLIAAHSLLLYAPVGTGAPEHSAPMVGPLRTGSGRSMMPEDPSDEMGTSEVLGEPLYSAPMVIPVRVMVARSMIPWDPWDRAVGQEVSPIPLFSAPNVIPDLEMWERSMMP